jgi:hypothetical protein
MRFVAVVNNVEKWSCRLGCYRDADPLGSPFGSVHLQLLVLGGMQAAVHEIDYAANNVSPLSLHLLLPGEVSHFVTYSTSHLAPTLLPCYHQHV